MVEMKNLRIRKIWEVQGQPGIDTVLGPEIWYAAAD